MANEFKTGEQRQVQVNIRELGITYLPIIPYCSAPKSWRQTLVVTHAVTRIENGTIIRFMDNLQGNDGDYAWVFSLASKPEIQFIVPSSCMSYLWRFKMKPITKLR
jgi:hypothetical protein